MFQIRFETGKTFRISAFAEGGDQFSNPVGDSSTGSNPGPPARQSGSGVLFPGAL
jgi:hypothetical protein